MKKIGKKTKRALQVAANPAFSQAYEKKRLQLVGKRLQKARKDKKLTRKQLAAQAEVDKAAIVLIERGHISDMVDFELFAKLLDVDTTWLTHGIGLNEVLKAMEKQKHTVYLRHPEHDGHESHANGAEKPEQAPDKHSQLALHVAEILRVAKQAPLGAYRKAFLKVIEHALDHNHNDAMMGRVADAVVRMMHLAIEGKKDALYKKSADITEALVDAVAEQTKGKGRS
jgi:transcriptional regulator with XRE-family HTH domain